MNPTTETRRWQLVALTLAALLVGATAHAGFEWRDVVQDVIIQADGSVVVVDERTLWTDEDFGEAFLCIQLTPTQRVTLLEGSGAVSAGPPASAYQQPCAGGTEVVVRQEQRVQERRVRWVYRLDGALDVYRDVVQWYWQILERNTPTVLGYRLRVTAPGPMAAPFDAYVHRFANPELPSMTLSDDRRVLTVTFKRVPSGDGVEIRYLMDPTLFAARGTEDGHEQLLRDEARLAGLELVETPLHRAAREGTAADVHHLLRGGADPNARDDTSHSPLHLAAAYNPDPDVVRRLVTAGATVDARTLDGATPLHLAAAVNPNPDVTRALLAAGADVDARGYLKGTPLMLAALVDRLTTLETLLAAGADPHARDEHGMTALMHAARDSGDPAIVLALLRAGSDARARDLSGLRAIDHARTNDALTNTDAFWELNDASY